MKHEAHIADKLLFAATTASIFDSDGARSYTARGSTSQLPPDTDMTDVEMSSLTPPSHKVTDFRTHGFDQTGELADDSMTKLENLPQSGSSKAVPSQHVRRKRSVLSRKGKRLAHLQSRDLVPASRGLHSSPGVNHGEEDDDDDDASSYGTEDDNEDEDEHGLAASRRKGTPSRIRSITKYAVTYILPNAVSPLPNQPVMSSTSTVNYMDKPALLLGYAQLIFNASILSTFLYLLYHVVRTVQRDVAEKVRAYEMGTFTMLLHDS